jgi:hypothetical protein
MESFLFLNKETYEVIYSKNTTKVVANSTKEFNDNNISRLIDLIKDMDEMELNSNYYSLKLENNKNVIYRKSLETNLAILIISDKNVFKRLSLVDISKTYLDGFVKYFYTQINDNSLKKSQIGSHPKLKEITLMAIEETTYKFIEFLRSNKLYAKFIYLNYNTNVLGNFTYKKSKMESTSVILYNSNKDSEKINEGKDTMLQRSTIKEKELNIEFDKKANPPSRKKIFIKKFNNAKGESTKKKFATKYLGTNFFIDKYV